MYPLDRVILHSPADPALTGQALIVTVPACRPVKGRRVRDEDERNCHGDPAAVNCQRCLRLRTAPTDPPTVVIFRKWPDGEILALFPGEPHDAARGLCISYQHIGQHSGADYAGCMASTKRATAAEYAPLLKELRQIGYDNLQIRLRWQPRRRSR